MTTTLRPSEPLRQLPDGGRARRYLVCVNSRPVGSVRVRTSPADGPSVALVEELRIDEPDRRRGRGTVAALAAEEVARGWGCRSVRVTVPAGATAALSLARALGYRQCSSLLGKDLAGPPPALPEGSRFRPMTPAEWAGRRPGEPEPHARHGAGRGAPEADARAGREHTAPPEDGPDTEGARLGVLEHEGAVVGRLWIALRDGEPYVRLAEVDEDRRGRGHGRALMLAAETEARALGGRTLALTVRTSDTPAERLCASLGYTARQHTFGKPLL